MKITNSILLIHLVLLFGSCTQSTQKESTDVSPCLTVTDTLPAVFSGTKKMILVPSGSFLMGSTDGSKNEQIVHEVKISGFYMDETPVTYVDFEMYVAKGGSPTRYWSYSSYNQPDQPITGISWYHAVDYCNWRSLREGYKPYYLPTTETDAWGLKSWKSDSTSKGYRLPTEAEWEYAARGGLQGMDYPWGNEFRDEWANYDTDKGHKESRWWRLASVTSQKKNSYGLYGMSGNVWEWCNDWYLKDYYSKGPTCNPGGPEDGRTKAIRGGGWGSPDPGYLKVYKRSYAAPSNYNYSIGFRCVRPAFSKPVASSKEKPVFYRYPDNPTNPVDITEVDFYSEEFVRKLGVYLKDNFPQCLYFLQPVDQQPKTTPLELAQLIVDESKKASINPLFVTSIMISESGFATVSFPRWWNNPMAYHWQNKLMVKGKPSYNADKSRNRKYKDLRSAIRNYSRIRRDIYFERAQKDLHAFHLLYVGYEAQEWMYTVGKVFREVANVQISPHEPAENVGRYIYSDWK